MKVIVAANPIAGARANASRVEELKSAIGDAGFEAVLIPDLDEFAAGVKEAHAQGELRAVVAAGGDGTASAVANRIAADVPLLHYPLGTENLLARFLGIRRDPAQACEILRTGKTRQMDAGIANGRMFLLMASCGFDAEVVRRVQEKRRGHITRLSYVQPTLESLHEYSHPDIRVYCDAPIDNDGEPDVLGKWAFVMNVPIYAGGMPIVSAADGADGQVDLCIFKRGTPIHDLAYLSSMFLRQHEHWTDCEIRQAARLRIDSDEPVPYQLDGDFAGHLPIEIEVAPGRVTYLAPEAAS